MVQPRTVRGEPMGVAIASSAPKGAPPAAGDVHDAAPAVTARVIAAASRRRVRTRMDLLTPAPLVHTIDPSATPPPAECGNPNLEVRPGARGHQLNTGRR